MKKTLLFKTLIFLLFIGLTQGLTAQTQDFFRKVEIMPEYPGGQDALSKFIKDNINYPKQGIEDKTEGIVYVTFIVEKDGTLSQINATKSIGTAFEKEAENVVKKMPKWKAGMHNGENVRVMLSLPIEFYSNK